MRRKLPPLNALLAFDAAARSENFTAAARELNVAQPAISRHIANLERWLDLDLFDRSGSVPRLTDAGIYLADVTSGVFDRIELAVETVPRRRSDEVVIGASFGIMHMWLMPRLTKMRAATTGILNFVTADDYAELARAQIDGFIQFTTGEETSGLSDFLFPEQCYVLASPEFLEAHPELDAEDLAGTLRPEWLLDHGDPYDAGWMTWTIWYALHGRQAPDPHLWREVRSYPAMLDMVTHGEGVAIGSVGLDDEYIKKGQLRRLGPVFGRPKHGYQLSYSKEALERPAFANIRKALLDSVA